MKLKGNPLALRHLFENEDAIRAGHQPPHRILLIGTGGGMCCIRMGAYLTAWRDAGLARAVDHAITVSGSGGALGAYLSGLPHRANRHAVCLHLRFWFFGRRGTVTRPQAAATGLSPPG